VLRPADLVQRRFAASRPDALWVADFTYLRSWQGVSYFSFVHGRLQRRIVGWQLATSMRTSLVLDALRMALSRRTTGADVELVHHSDAGSQYTSGDFQQVLDDHRVLAGRSARLATPTTRDGGELRRHVQDRTDRRPGLQNPSPAGASAVIRWVAWYNLERLCERIGDIPPAEYEARYYAIPQEPAA